MKKLKYAGLTFILISGFLFFSSQNVLCSSFGPDTAGRGNGLTIRAQGSCKMKTVSGTDSDENSGSGLLPELTSGIICEEDSSWDGLSVYIQPGAEMTSSDNFTSQIEKSLFDDAVIGPVGNVYVIAGNGYSGFLSQGDVFAVGEVDEINSVSIHNGYSFDFDSSPLTVYFSLKDITGDSVWESDCEFCFSVQGQSRELSVSPEKVYCPVQFEYQGESFSGLVSFSQLYLSEEEENSNEPNPYEIDFKSGLINGLVTAARPYLEGYTEDKISVENPRGQCCQTGTGNIFVRVRPLDEEGEYGSELMVEFKALKEDREGTDDIEVEVTSAENASVTGWLSSRELEEYRRGKIPLLLDRTLVSD